MNRWSNNYYSQQAKRDSPRPPQGPSSSSPVSPSRRNSTKTVSNGVVTLCVFRVAHLTQLTLKSFIERQGVRVLDIEQTSHKGNAYRSFMVAVTERDVPRLLNKGFWPGLVSCRPLQDGDPWHNEVFSRRHAREVVASTRKTDDTSPRSGRRISRVGVALEDNRRPVQQVTASTNGRRNNEQVGKENRGPKSKYINKSEGKNDRKSVSPQKERLQVSKNNSLTEKGSKSTTHKGVMSAKGPTKAAVVKVKQKMGDKNTTERKDTTKTTTMKVKRKISDENKLKRQAPSDAEKGRTQNPTSKTLKTRKSSSINVANITKNTKPKSEGVTGTKNSYSEGIPDKEIWSDGRDQLRKPRFPPLRVSTVNRKYKNLSSSTKNKENRRDSFSTPKDAHSSWFKPMQALLRVSSEEALGRLLGPDFERLVIQENISDEELFLGVRVLAHCARADVGPNMQQNLVYMICQPQIITLIKEFTRTVEEKYKERAESYFWHLGEFLDLYIVHNIFLQGMLSLFTTCLSKVLALSYRNYVSQDLVKVYRGMHASVFTNLP